MARRRNIAGLGRTTRWNVYDGPGPEGVPNPYVPQIELYPSYVHGADYTRPVFAQPFFLNPHNVLNGLGAEEELLYAQDDPLRQAQNQTAVMAGAVAGATALALIGGIIGGLASPGHRNAGTGILLGALGGGLLGLIPAAVGAGAAIVTLRKAPSP
jgi:hypothetical protein